MVKKKKEIKRLKFELREVYWALNEATKDDNLQKIHERLKRAEKAEQLLKEKDD